METFHIVWFIETGGLTTGKNYEEHSAIAALLKWQLENPGAKLAVMYSVGVTEIAKAERGNEHLDNMPTK